MIYKAKDILNKDIDLGIPVTVNINKQEDVPADDIIVIFPGLEDINELKNIYVYKQSAEEYFVGIVDEQSTYCTANGIYTKISARSLAGSLIDNEAKPQTYNTPSLKEIFKRHIEPYGFCKILGNDVSFSDKFVVVKGMSEWNVLEEFCKKFLNTTPKVNGNIVDATNKATSKKVIFKNSPNNINYTEIKREINRCNVISNILIMPVGSLNYSVNVKDEAAINRGIKRCRYLNASEKTSQSIKSAQDFMLKEKRQSYLIKVECPGEVEVSIKDKAQIEDTIIGNIDGLLVCKIEYSLENSKQKTEITLRKEV